MRVMGVEAKTLSELLFLIVIFTLVFAPIVESPLITQSCTGIECKEIGQYETCYCWQIDDSDGAYA